MIRCLGFHEMKLGPILFTWGRDYADAFARGTSSRPAVTRSRRRAQLPFGAGAAAAWSRVAAQEARTLRASSEEVPGSKV